MLNLTLTKISRSETKLLSDIKYKFEFFLMFLKSHLVILHSFKNVDVKTMIYQNIKNIDNLYKKLTMRRRKISSRR